MTSPGYQAWLKANTSAGKATTSATSKTERTAKPAVKRNVSSTPPASNLLARFLPFAKAADTAPLQATPEAKLSPLRRLATRADMARELVDAAGFDTPEAAAAFAIAAAKSGRAR